MLQSGIKFFTIILILFISLVSKGQDFIADTTETEEYPFINYEADTIINAALLTPFFNKLLDLENCDSNHVSIVHIGDSHIQADFLTREVRKNLQLRFGNAGRGLIFPLKVAGTNEPSDFHSATNTGWTVAKINGQAKTPQPGIAGISMLTEQGGGYFEITTYNHDDLDYSFNQVSLIHAKDTNQFDCRITDSPNKFGYLMSSEPMDSGDCITWVPFLKPTNFVRVQSEPTEINQQSATINGIVLKNGEPGVLYHSIGINGARFSDYNNSPLFYQQLQLLKPDLVIISLGTNEGADIKINDVDLSTSIITMLHNIRVFNPNVSILIATPTDDYFNKKYKNVYLETVHRALVESAKEGGAACWDLYDISGGFGSCVEWRQAALMQRDGVHFNKQGYILQGSLLYKALIDGYLKYAAD